MIAPMTEPLTELLTDPMKKQENPFTMNGFPVFRFYDPKFSWSVQSSETTMAD